MIDLHAFWDNFTHNLFKPLLLFFYMGFTIPLLKIQFEYPHALYQSITMYLLLAIGWHGGEELASLSTAEFTQALGFMGIGFIVNTIIGIVAHGIIRSVTRMRKIDAATVAGYYGSDSAGTFVTCLGVLATLRVAAETAGQTEFVRMYTPAAYMPVMLAVMEIPGCLVALFLVSLLRHQGMDAEGNAPGEPGYNPATVGVAAAHAHAGHHAAGNGADGHQLQEATVSQTVAHHEEGHTTTAVAGGGGEGQHHGHHHHHHHHHHRKGDPLLPTGHEYKAHPPKRRMGFLNPKVLHEVFFNPGLFLLFGGILIGAVCAMQGKAVEERDIPAMFRIGHKIFTSVTLENDLFFNFMFQGMLCLFLLEMGITACKRLKDLRTAGWGFIGFGLLAPNLFAVFGITVAHLYSHAIGEPFSVGTYALFSVLCGAASYIAVPAVQRLAIPEASPTLPLAASLGLTFSYNVTIGIPIYIEIAKAVTQTWPVGAA